LRLGPAAEILVHAPRVRRKQGFEREKPVGYEYSVEQFFEDTREEFSFEALTPDLSSPIPITVEDIHRPAFVLSGFMEIFLHERIQIIGETEILYLNSLMPAQQYEALERLFSQPLCCIIITKGLDATEGLIPLAEKHGIPILRTPHSTTPFIHSLTSHLEGIFAPRTTIHGSLVDVYGVGLLFSGRSGIGKSEVALDLVERGHRLVADDVVEITKHGDVLIGRGREHLRHFMEIRGLGIINVMDIFGIRAIRILRGDNTTHKPLPEVGKLGEEDVADPGAGGPGPPRNRKFKVKTASVI